MWARLADHIVQLLLFLTALLGGLTGAIAPERAVARAGMAAEQAASVAVVAEQVAARIGATVPRPGYAQSPVTKATMTEPRGGVPAYGEKRLEQRPRRASSRRPTAAVPP